VRLRRSLLLEGGPPVVAVRAPHATLSLETARSKPERARGLMGRRVLAAHHGMLFVFARDAVQYFWMKGTLVPLDMVFVSGKGVVTSVAAHVPVPSPGAPDTRLPRRQGRGRYVIELPAGEAARDGVRFGVNLRIPPFP
jgi:uncharacterized membrane protein (UPF0127 family)